LTGSTNRSGARRSIATGISFIWRWTSLTRSLDLPRPRYLDALLADAEALSAAFDCLRVDFYASDSDYVFGELTNLPAGGLGRFSSPDGAQRFTRAFFA
jgi:hypothetical protein